jgi:hypothetical protein
MRFRQNYLFNSFSLLIRQTGHIFLNGAELGFARFR